MTPKMDDGMGSFTSPNAILLPICAFISIIVCCVPLRLLCRVKTIAAFALVVNVIIQNIFTLVNAAIWPNNNWSTWWNGAGLCDIEVLLRGPLYTLVATSICGITRLLATAVDTENPRLNETRALRRRAVIIDVVVCFTVPVLQIVLHYIVQAERYGIVSIYGCIDIVDESWPTMVIENIWPSLFALISSYYAGESASACLRFRADCLDGSGSGVPPSSES